ncbi:CPBP family intramembrane glutamic endopeptidase [Promicromonospora sp. Marseille-Q5078]
MSAALPAVRTTAPAPSVRAATAVFVAYAVVVVGLMRLSGIDYDHLFDTTRSTLLGAVLPLAAGAVLLGVVLWRTGWAASGVFRDATRLRMGVLWALPVVMVLVVALTLASVDWGAFDAGHLLVVLLAALLVGFTEDTLFRGIILRALRGALRSEASAAVLTTVWFGLFHLTNLLLGEPGAVLQVVFAALSGFGFYVARRGFGALVAGMALHAAWDFSTFLSGVHHTDGAAASAGYFLIVVVYVLAAASIVVVLVRDRRTPPPITTATA